VPSWQPRLKFLAVSSPFSALFSTRSSTGKLAFYPSPATPIPLLPALVRAARTHRCFSGSRKTLADTGPAAVMVLCPFGLSVLAKDGCFSNCPSNHGRIHSRNTSSAKGSVRDDANGFCQNILGGNKNSSWTKTYFCSRKGVLVSTVFYRCCQSRAGNWKCSVTPCFLDEIQLVSHKGRKSVGKKGLVSLW